MTHEARIYEVDGGYVVADDGGWYEGVYRTRAEAENVAGAINSTLLVQLERLAEAIRGACRPGGAMMEPKESHRPRWWRRRRQKVAFTWPNGWHCYYTPRAHKHR